MFTRSKHIAPSAIALLAAILSTVGAQPVSAQISAVADPVGDALFNASAFQDILTGQMTKTASGDFELLMEMASPVPVAPPLSPPGTSGMWWFWLFDLDPTASPQGYPVAPGLAQFPEFLVVVSWDGTAFAGTAVDRRPLLTGGAAIITPVPFSINGTIVVAVLASTLIGVVPPSFGWGPRAIDWSGPVGSAGYHFVDGANSIFNPSQPESAQISTVFDPVGDTLFPFNAPFQDVVRGQMTKMGSRNYDLLMEMAGPVPVNPRLPPQANHQMWWFWVFDLDPTTRPSGYPWQAVSNGRPPEFLVVVSWDGTAFAGTAIDRRPLLTGGEAIITPVPCRINGTIVEADLASELIGAVPTFNWGPFTMSWSGPVGSEGANFADYVPEFGTILNP